VYTIDASAWVNAFDAEEVGHEISHRMLRVLADRNLPIVVSTLVLAEVAGAISRTRQDAARATLLAETLRDLPNVTLVSIDTTLAELALSLAAGSRLRGADAIYAAVAVHAGCTLITLDNEHLTRLTGVVTVRTPAMLLDELVPPEPDSISRDAAEEEGGEATDPGS
jgi:predicted nucleic acid-binding protein